MLRITSLASGATIFGLLAVATPASADHRSGGVQLVVNQRGLHLNVNHGRSYRPKCGVSYRHGGRAGYYKNVWVPPVYRTIHEYDYRGRHIDREVLVRGGYYKRVWVKRYSSRHGRRYEHSSHSGRRHSARRYGRRHH
jgi:hypothetical protein